MSEPEHSKCQCHVGHFDKFFWKYSSYSPDTYGKLNDTTKKWEDKSINKLYKDNESPSSKTDLKIKLVLGKHRQSHGT